jgi:hypothetical protein
MNDQPNTIFDMPCKPVGEKEQVAIIWDVVSNHIPHALYTIKEDVSDVKKKMSWADMKINFVLAFMGLVLVLSTISLTLLVEHIGK